MGEKLEPFVVLIDLDGTIQGNVIPQIKEKELIDFVNNSLLKKTKKKVQYQDHFLYKDIRKGLIRPYIQNALSEIKKKHSNVEFFIYTASSDEWANFLIPKINRFLFGLKRIINKPYFTRKHCIPNGYKSISVVKPLIKNSLNKKYPNANFNNIFLIDNNRVLHPQEAHLLFHCPTYDTTVINCPLRVLNKTIIDIYYAEIAFFLYRRKVNSVDEFLKLYYTQSVNMYIDSDNYNKKFKQDKYWSKVKDVFLTFQHIKSQHEITMLIKKMKTLIYES